MTPEVRGNHDEQFAPVVEAFQEHLTSTPYGGAGLAVYVGGKLVVDVWGGIANIVTGSPWDRDTLAVSFSCAKGLTAILVLQLVEQGILELDAPVERYWPEYAKHGKGHTTLRQILAHRAGVPLVDAALSFDDVVAVEPVVKALEDQQPLWEPGTAHTYHALTVGHLAGEIVRRATGRTLGTEFRTRLAEPFELDLWIGLPTAEHSRVALTLPADTSQFPDDLVAVLRDALTSDDRALRALSYNGAFHIPVPGITTANSTNDPAFWATEMPAGNGIGTARSFAKLYAAAISDVGAAGAPDLLSAATIEEATRPQSEGEPFLGVLLPPFPRWGTGFMIPWELRPMLGPTSFGHDGAAGGLCFADREARVGFAFLPNVMGPMPDVRSNPIVEQLHRCLA